MKPLILLLLFISCKNDNKPKPEVDIPINTTDTVLAVGSPVDYVIKKSDTSKKFVFTVEAKGDSAIIQNKSKWQVYVYSSIIRKSK